MIKIREAYRALTSPLARKKPGWDFGAVWRARTLALFGPDENAHRAVQGSTRGHDEESAASPSIVARKENRDDGPY
jgi:hypothetical protein